MDKERAIQLLHELEADPYKFTEQGKTSQLLQEYFRGFDIETLRPLLKSKDFDIQSTASFIVSELGENAWPLIDDIVPLLYHENLGIRYDILESIFICSLNYNTEKFSYVLASMIDEKDVIRTRSTELVSNASEKQIRKAIHVFSRKEDLNNEIHFQCLQRLLEIESNDPDKVIEMLHSEFPLIRKYGAILAKKLFKVYPDLLKEALVNDDADIQVIVKEFFDEM